jgi:hypothetical protein
MPQSDTDLAYIISYPCNSSNWWWARILNPQSDGWAFGTPGNQMEFVTQDKAWALGFSGAGFKLETPDASQDYLTQMTSEIAGGWSLWADTVAGYYPLPAAKGEDLQAFTGAGGFVTLPPDGWIACVDDSAYCAS